MAEESLIDIFTHTWLIHWFQWQTWNQSYTDNFIFQIKKWIMMHIFNSNYSIFAKDLNVGYIYWFIFFLPKSTIYQCIGSQHFQKNCFSLNNWTFLVFFSTSKSMNNYVIIGNYSNANQLNSLRIFIVNKLHWHWLSF